MSTLLEQAIVDAKALKEAALKNAEATIIDKYSDEVKSTLNRLLEQDELGDIFGDLGEEEAPEGEPLEEEQEEIAEGVPDAFTEDVQELGGVNEGDEATVEINFAELEEAIKDLREQLETEEITEEVVEEDETVEEAKCSSDEEVMQEEEDIELTEESIKAMISELLFEEGEEEEEVVEEEVELQEEDEISEAFIDAIVEKLTVDTGASLSGWAGRSSHDVKYQMELEMAHRRTTEVEEELEALKKAQEELVFENKKLKDSLANHREAISTLKESVQDVNLSNARLLYTNRVLRDTSLNERQKTRIVEAISKAGSVEEAKTIHETLQSTVAAAPKASPQSLSEAITRPTSIIRASRKQEKQTDPLSSRMRKLAGIE
jgi:hypothetical protein